MDAYRITDLLSSCEFEVPQMLWAERGAGDPVACERSAENPLGETVSWVMKAPLQRDYIGT